MIKIDNGIWQLREKITLQLIDDPFTSFSFSRNELYDVADTLLKYGQAKFANGVMVVLDDDGSPCVVLPSVMNNIKFFFARKIAECIFNGDKVFAAVSR